jgi:hypothetical protein
MRRLADMTPEDVKPVRVTFAHQHGAHVQGRTGRESKPPQVQTHSDHESDRSIEDRERPRRASHEDRLGQCDMERHFVAFDFFRARHRCTNFRLPARAAVETKEGHAEAGRRDRDGHAQQQAEDAAQPTAFAECETKSDDNDG